jgi:hypothetical protein
MTHLEVENLASDYLEGLLDTALRAQVDEHLAGCADCRDLVAGVRHVMDCCQMAERLEPPPWLIAKIMQATVGQQRPSLLERAFGAVRQLLQPRIAYPVLMAVFSFSVILSAAGVNLRHFRLADLNPRTWAYQANRSGHLLVARAEKFYYDLRVVYETEAWLRTLRSQSQLSRPEETPGEAPRKGGPGSTQFDSSMSPWLACLTRDAGADSPVPTALRGAAHGGTTR